MKGATGVSVNTYYFDVSDEGPTNPSAEWFNPSNAFDGSTSTSSVVSASEVTVLSGGGTTAPISGSSIASVRARIYANVVDSSDAVYWEIWTDGKGESLMAATENGPFVAGWQPYHTVAAPSGGWTWQKINDLEVYVNKSGVNDSAGVRKFEIEVTS